jgi:hypothetical protein
MRLHGFETSSNSALIDMDLSMDWREQEAKLLGVA